MKTWMNEWRTDDFSSKEQNFTVVTNWKMQKDIFLRSVSKYAQNKSHVMEGVGNKIVPCGEVW